jgi:hypothetical protein
MHQLSEKAKPFLGPNLYIATPGVFTQLHQDGHGTVDSGHLNLCGYNEVVMLRRLTERHKVEACKILQFPSGTGTAKKRYNPVSGLPHDEAKVCIQSMI